MKIAKVCSFWWVTVIIVIVVAVTAVVKVSAKVKKIEFGDSQNYQAKLVKLAALSKHGLTSFTL
jgi:hypothetical protein